MPTQARPTLPFAAAIAVAVVLAGCGAVPSGAKMPTGKTSKSVKTTASPKPAKSATPTATPTLAPVDDEPSPSPKAVDPTKKVVVSGMVYGTNGAALSGVVVHAKSLSAAAPYEAEVKTDTGSYVLNGVPSGANLEIVATKPGWTSRRRVGSFDADAAGDNAFDFGSREGDGGDAAPFGLANAPEITGTTPATNGTGVDARQVRVRLELSEPLDAENRARLARALRLLPANDAANGGAEGTTTDLATSEDAAYPRAVAVDGNVAVAPYALRAGSTFMNDPTRAASVAWDSEGRVALLSFDAPLLSSSDADCAYQLALVSAGPDERIRDAEGNQLGTDAAGGTTAYPEAGALVPGVFKARRLRYSAIEGLTEGSREARWAATHDDVVRFEVARDEQAPTLAGVRAVYIGDDTRLELTFDEPMAAFNGTTGGFVAPTLGDDPTDLANYSFVLDESTDEAGDESLDGDRVAVEVDPRTATTFGARADLGKEFRFAPGAFAASRAGAPAGSVVVEIDDRDPRKVWIVIAERPRFFAAAAAAIRARAEGVADPAGNATSEKRADAVAPIGSL
jgi:hypothetical protein